LRFCGRGLIIPLSVTDQIVINQICKVEIAMTTIEFTVDETLLTEIDRVTRSLAMSRANFIRAALELALRNQHTLALEKQHAQGYKKHPMKSSEIGEWESEQVWGEK